ncbi:MAG TPA: autotransporter [Solirubrobacteraceae bacterium]|nr:autotransporter [Solirubrobacteraceae bacterium]
MRSGYKQRDHGQRAVALFAALASSSALILVVGSAASRAERPAIAWAAHTLNGTDTAHLHLVHQYENVLYEEGPATGALAGHVRAELNVGATFRGHVTFYTQAGSITVYGSASPHGTGRYASFGGSFTVTGGSGRYRHAHGRGGFYGTFDRRTYAVVVQTTGSFYY